MKADFRRRLPHWLVWLLTILFLPVVLFAIWIAKEGLADQVWPADVVVVFGNRIDPDGQPSAWLQARLDRAVELKQEGVAQNFIVSGGLGKEGFDEARVMQAYLVKQGIPAANIWLDDHGETTWRTAQNVVELMRQRGWKNVILVSQFYHLPRARMALQMSGAEQVGSAHAAGFFITDLLGLLREVIAYPVYWYQGQP